jgi:phage terminase large subunit-like protein
VNFFSESLTHIEGQRAGQPLVLERWQAAQVGCAFGWFRPDGTRRYREVFDYEPRKNGKTTKCGGLINLVALCDNEPGAQIYSAAADREQAALVYRQAKGMILNNAELERECKVFSTSKSIEYPDTVVYKALSADADTKHGFNSHFVIIDELHAHPDRDLVDVLITSTGSRKHPLIWYITTADFDRPSICNEKYDYACKVRDGIVDDPSFLPAIFEASPSDDWKSEATWAKANPNLGISVSVDYLRRECQKAIETPSYENTFKRLHLNLRTQQDVRWLPMDLWDRGGEKFDPEILTGKACHVGIDFGWRDDYAAMVLVFDLNGTFYVLPWFWLPEEGKRDKRREPTSGFVAQGLVNITSGTSTDIESIYAKLNECRSLYDVRSVALDPANARKQGQDLMNDGYNVVEFIQNKRSYNEPCRLLESLLKDSRLRHGGHKVLRWMASNTAVELNGMGEIMPKKIKSTEKIDGICALVMALGRAMLDTAQVDDGPSVMLL